jgi:hypothetical protein
MNDVSRVVPGFLQVDVRSACPPAPGLCTRGIESCTSSHAMRGNCQENVNPARARDEPAVETPMRRRTLSLSHVPAVFHPVTIPMQASPRFYQLDAWMAKHSICLAPLAALPTSDLFDLVSCYLVKASLCPLLYK